MNIIMEKNNHLQTFSLQTLFRIILW